MIRRAFLAVFFAGFLTNIWLPSNASALDWVVGPNPDRMGPDIETLQAELRIDGKNISVMAQCGETFNLSGFRPALNFSVSATTAFNMRVPIRTTVERNMSGGFSSVSEVNFRASNGRRTSWQPAVDDPYEIQFPVTLQNFGESVSDSFPFLIEIDFAGGASIIEVPNDRTVISFSRECLSPNEAPTTRDAPAARRPSQAVNENGASTTGQPSTAPAGSPSAGDAEMEAAERYVAWVTRVSSDDTLNVRSGPSSSFRIVREYQNNFGPLAVLECTGNADKQTWFEETEAGRQPTGVWCQVADNLELGIPVGWLNAWYLTPRNPCRGTSC